MTLHFSAARPWLLLACFALGLSALLAILLVLSRAPHVQELFGLAPFFHTILVLHVNFAVLVWLLSFIGFIWVNHTEEVYRRFHVFAFIIAVLGAVLMLCSPLVLDAKPIMSNYIPVIDSFLFFIGLCLFAFAISILAWPIFRHRAWDVLRLSAALWLVALMTFIVHFFWLNHSEPQLFFESLFWGGGHVLQFVYVFILGVVWRWNRTEHLVYFVGQKLSALLITVLVFGFMLFLEPGQLESRQAYTFLMQAGMLLLLLPMLWWFFKEYSRNTIKNMEIGLVFSAVLIVLGVIIGLLIRDDSVIVTAHYHAMNAAITIAFMGLAYLFVQQYSRKLHALKWMRFQLQLYAMGMILYVLGMAGSGWLGVPRKSAVMLEDNSLERISMGIMGLGGALSIVATLVFVGLIFYAFLGQYKTVGNPNEAK